jgi:hypothetical protein
VHADRRRKPLWRLHTGRNFTQSVGCGMARLIEILTVVTLVLVIWRLWNGGRK